MLAGTTGLRWVEITGLSAADSAAHRKAPTFHDLRHRAVSLILHSIKDVKLAQRITGHSSAQLILDTEAEVFEQTCSPPPGHSTA